MIFSRRISRVPPFFFPAEERAVVRLRLSKECFPGKEWIPSRFTSPVGAVPRTDVHAGPALAAVLLSGPAAPERAAGASGSPPVRQREAATSCSGHSVRSAAAGTECCQHPLLPRPRLPRRHLRCVRSGAACRAGGTGTAPGRCPTGAGAGRTRRARPLCRPLAGGAGAAPERGRERGSPAAPGTPRPPAQTGTELWKNKVELGACGLRIALHSQGR